MKLASVRVATVAAVSVCTSHLWGQSANNPIQVALLRWYQANIVTQFSTCTGVNGLAFDGDHVWVACAVDNELEEFNAGDGALVRTVTGVSNPYSLVYDGANIWATGSGTITEVNASTGSIVGTPITVGSQPTGLAFDGSEYLGGIWTGIASPCGRRLQALRAEQLEAECTENRIKPTTRGHTSRRS
jgi:hypothetical protein